MSDDQVVPVEESKLKQTIEDNAALNDIQTKSELVNALREIMLMYITDDDLSIAVIADIAGVSTRSLQRIMKNHGVTYNELLNAARRQFAETGLTNPRIKISEIAYQLGYNDTAHFTRAFKRWTGMTPTEFKKKTT